MAESALTDPARILATATADLVDKATFSTDIASLETALQNAADSRAMAVAIHTTVARVALVISGDPKAGDKLVALQAAHEVYTARIDEAARAAAQKFAHSIEYSYTKPKNQPELSNIRYVGSGGFGAAEQWRATFNGALDFYNQKPAGVNVSTFRDLQLSAQLDRIFFARQALNVTFSAAGYYQWMKDCAVILIAPGELAPGTNIPLVGSAPALLAEPGSIGLGQLKLSFGVRDTKLKIPISFTFANRTELIKSTKTVFGGQIGLSYDFDSLFKPNPTTP